MIGGQATRTWISRAPPTVRMRETSTFIVVERTMSLRPEHPFAFSTSRSGVYLRAALFAAAAAFDERPTAVAVADQAFGAGTPS